MYVLSVFSEALGDCSFLNTCFHMDMCKYVHYEIDYPDTMAKPGKAIDLTSSTKQSYIDTTQTRLFPAQVKIIYLFFDWSIYPYDLQNRTPPYPIDLAQ